MKKLAIIITLCVLVGCSTVPVNKSTVIYPEPEINECGKPTTNKGYDPCTWDAEEFDKTVKQDLDWR